MRASEICSQELEEITARIVGGIGGHRQQIAFDYTDDGGLAHPVIRRRAARGERDWPAIAPTQTRSSHCRGPLGRYISKKLSTEGAPPSTDCGPRPKAPGPNEAKQLPGDATSTGFSTQILNTD